MAIAQEFYQRGSEFDRQGKHQQVIAESLQQLSLILTTLRLIFIAVML
jgi:hypothetical protein